LLKLKNEAIGVEIDNKEMDINQLHERIIEDEKELEEQDGTIESQKKDLEEKDAQIDKSCQIIA
jgi:chromosome segregation ATPase